MVYYNAYVQLTNNDILVIVTNEKSKNQVLVADSFQMSIKDYLNENGLIQYPLALAEDIAKRLNTDRYSVKDITLIMSPAETDIQISQENVLTSSKELIEVAKTNIEKTFKKPPEAYEIAWLHTGNIFDSATPISVFLQYCYPLREINKMKKAFQKNKIHVSNVLLPELATAALFAQYYDEFNDPTTMIVESGYSSSPNSAMTTYWFKRNVLENVNKSKTGLSSIIREIGNIYTQFSSSDILSLMMGCGIFAEYPTDDAEEILSINEINKKEWFAVATRAFHGFANALKSEIQRRTEKEKPDVIILTGPLASIPGIKEHFYHEYSLVVDIWQNKFDTKIGQISVNYNSSSILPPTYATVIGAVYYQHWAKGMKKGTLSRPVFEFNVTKFNKYALLTMAASLIYAGFLFIPGYIELKNLEAENMELTQEVQIADNIKSNIERYKQNIAAQKQFIEKSQKETFDIKEFIYSAILLKPDDITLISIDTPNFLENVVDEDPYYYIRKAVEEKQNNKNNTPEKSSAEHASNDVRNKDWTFGLNWEGITLANDEIENFLEQNSLYNIPKYVVTKVIIRGYGPQDKIGLFARDLGSINGVYVVDNIKSREMTIPDGNGTPILTNVFELTVWFGGETNVANTQNTN